MLRTADILDTIKALLDMDGTDEYDTKLEVLIPSAMSMLEVEGVPNVLSYGSDLYEAYVACVAHKVALNIDLDVDATRLAHEYFRQVVLLKQALRD